MKKKQYFFVDHKVMAVAICILMLLVGMISLTTLPIEQYPDIAPPTVSISTAYTGADAKTIMNSVIMPIEDKVNGVEHMTYISSKAYSSGEVEVSVYFEQGTDPDMAAVNVQNRVSEAMGLLPAEVTQVGVSCQKRQNGMLQIGSLVSTDDRFDEEFLANYIDINLAPRILRINGVGGVQNLGNTYSLRIWMKPESMAMYGLTPNDVARAIQSQNTVVPTGNLGECSNNTYQYTMEYRGRLKSIEEFRNIVISADNSGKVLHLGDVADVELGVVSYTFSSETDKHPGVSFIVTQVSGANATQINAQLSQLYKEMESELPPGVKFEQLQTADDFLNASFHNVVETLIIAIILVILVVLFFLQDFRATLIPSISIVVSLVGTFAVVKLAGFSLNLLTLFGLVLAIGTVVDDAIVVVEAVMTKLELGYKSPARATTDALHEVLTPVISCTLVFMAVFIPVTFMSGTSGAFFTQFGVTIAAAVGLSCINALTLCPALCAVILRPKQEGDAAKKDVLFYVRRAYEASFSALSTKYLKAVERVIQRPKVVVISLLAACVLMVVLMRITPTEMVPQEDQGVVLVNIAMPPGYTMDQSSRVMDQLYDKVSSYEEVEHVAKITGYGMISGAGSNYGSFVVRLKHWDDRKGRKHEINSVIARIYIDCLPFKEAQVMPFQMPQIPGYGKGNSIDLEVLNQNSLVDSTFVSAVETFATQLAQRKEIGSVFNNYDASFPKYQVDVDAAMCERAGTNVQDVLSVLGQYCGGAYVSNFNDYGKVYRVMIASGPEYRLNPQSLNNIYVRVNGGRMAPISQFVTLTPKVGTAVEERFNLYPSINLNVTAAAGYSSGQAQKAIAEVFKATMPQGTGYEYSGLSREEAKNAQSNTTLFIYLVIILLIFLILACLYNSWLIPFSVLLSVPFGLMGVFAVAAPLASFGITNNVYLQTGVIMLIGLLAKTAILITEYAVDKHKQGLSIRDAAVGAAKERFRPILMTVLSMVAGMIPLVVASGAGCVGNRSLSVGVIAGMLVGTVALIFVTPVFYIMFASIQDKYTAKHVALDDEQDADESIMVEHS